MPGAVHFILNDEAVTVRDAAPTVTVLDWLRGPAGLPGTKEGCAEGDCGACAIVLGSETRGQMRYEAVNACLMALPQLDGKLVLTVEGLAAPGSALHPVQRALVEADGTQCGFCTPGFVMALFAFAHSGEAADDDTVHDALAGNLCRCTGYRPIVDAAKRVGGRVADRFTAREGALAARVAALPRDGIRAYAAGGRRFFAPRSLAGLARLCAAHPQARLLAGGTDLGLAFGKARQPVETLISVSRVLRLRRIERRGRHLEIGAAATLARVLPAIDEHYPAFARLLRRFGSRQIRNLATLGGNVCTASPIGDTLPCLLALEATVLLRRAGAHREMPLEAFLAGYRRTALAPGEFLEAVRLPLLAEGTRFHAWKVAKRFDQDISAVVGACCLRVEGGVVTDLRLACGGMAATPKRARTCEAALLGKPWTAAAAAAAAPALAKDYAPIGDFRASAGYRSRVAANLLRRLHLQTAGGPAPTEVAAL